MLLFAAIIFPQLVYSSDKSPSDQYRISFLLGTAKVKKQGSQIFLKNGDYIKEGETLFVDSGSMVELTPLSGDARFKISGPIIYHCSGLEVAKEKSRNNLMYRLYSKLTKATYHYYPRTVVSGVRGEKDSETDERNKKQSAALNEAIDLFKSRQLDRSLTQFEALAHSKGLQRHVQYLINFYRAEILFEKMEYTQAMDLYLEIYKTRNRKFKHREIAHAKGILCTVYTGKTDKTEKLISEYEESYGEDGAFTPLMIEIKSELYKNGNN